MDIFLQNLENRKMKICGKIFSFISSFFLLVVFGCDRRRYLGKLFGLVSRKLSELRTRTIQAFLYISTLQMDINGAFTIDLQP